MLEKFKRVCEEYNVIGTITYDKEWHVKIGNEFDCNPYSYGSAATLDSAIMTCLEPLVPTLPDRIDQLIKSLERMKDNV